MELLNATKMVAGYTMGLKPDGRESLVVVVKGTFAIPSAKEAPRLARKQVQLVEADQFTGEPGFSSTLYECDYAAVKKRCDVLFNGSAYAPGGKPTERVLATLRVGGMSKTVQVVGPRYWRRTVLGIAATPVEPFVAMSFSYDNAYGGIDDSHDDPTKKAAYADNPAGVGFHVNTAAEAINEKPLPNTEEKGKTVTNYKGDYRPMALGAVSRSFPARLRFAGTYDDAWLENQFPFLPEDFDERYYQAAPQDQQIDYPTGGEEIEMQNLTPSGRVAFKLPPLELPVEFFRSDYDSVTTQAVVDTLLIEPDLGRFLITWRASIPLRRNVFEIPLAVVGRMPRGWYRARRLGKTYYRSLDDLVVSKS